MEHLLEILNRIEEAERLLNKGYSPRLVIDLDGNVTIGWKDVHEARNSVYSVKFALGNIRNPEVVAENLTKWALEAYEKDNVYG